MTERFDSDGIRILEGDCATVLPQLAAESVDAIVTDPPYGLKFMGRKWDYDVPSVDVWRACLRVLKPGGHLLAFSGTRTYHRAVVNIEDAGFEIRDMIGWICGSGTTLRVALDLGHPAIGIDSDPHACNIVIDRLRQTVLKFEHLAAQSGPKPHVPRETLTDPHEPHGVVPAPPRPLQEDIC